MNRKLLNFATALLPICFLSAQQPDAQKATQQAHRERFWNPSPEAVRRAAEQRRNLRMQANAINDLAGHIQSLGDARKLVDLVAAEFSAELPPKWATRSIRNRIARAEYESAYEPGVLIPERHVADAWNDYLQKIGAPREVYVTTDEIHTLRDSSYIGSQLAWARGNQSIWTVPNIYAVGQNRTVANGCRPLEVLNILWKLAEDPDALRGTRGLIKDGVLLSDKFKSPSQPPSPGSDNGYLTARVVVMPPNPVEQAARRYMHDHGTSALNTAIDGLLKDLFRS